MQVVLVTNDLTVVSRVQGACAKAGAAMRTVGNLEQAIDGLGSETVDILIVDLSLPQFDVDAAVSAARSTASPVNVVAFGPHVHAAKLAAARRAGCDEVVSRGQFFAQLDAIFERRSST